MAYKHGGAKTDHSGRLGSDCTGRFGLTQCVGEEQQELQEPLWVTQLQFEPHIRVHHPPPVTTAEPVTTQDMDLEDEGQGLCLCLARNNGKQLRLSVPAFSKQQQAVCSKGCRCVCRDTGSFGIGLPCRQLLATA